jgi:CheY-like chemotaxis protein
VEVIHSRCRSIPSPRRFVKDQDLNREATVDDTDTIKVLLVGDNPLSFSLSRQLLERSGCECHFGGSLEAAKELLQLWQFDIVLTMHTVPGDTIRKLVSLVSGSGASLFTAIRVEESFWWVPVLQFGKESYGPAIRVGDFAHVLDDLRKQILVQR